MKDVWEEDEEGGEEEEKKRERGGGEKEGEKRRRQLVEGLETNLCESDRFGAGATFAAGHVISPAKNLRIARS